MASEESKARDRKLAEEALFKARGAGSAQAETDMFICGKCKGRRCTYFQMQTRSADEPMTTFVTCVNCNNHWKVRRGCMQFIKTSLTHPDTLHPWSLVLLSKKKSQECNTVSHIILYILHTTIITEESSFLQVPH